MSTLPERASKLERLFSDGQPDLTRISFLLRLQHYIRT